MFDRSCYLGSSWSSRTGSRIRSLLFFFFLFVLPSLGMAGRRRRGTRGGKRNSGVTAFFLLFCIDCENAMLGTGICVALLLGRLLASFVVVVVVVQRHKDTHHARRRAFDF
ncbi:hypothetical protein CMEL01_15902 [Colletotrichum melonis]|uniref:Uncharacterized protein n=1 Tax=Colletotrichum melonis TaxID=1209925 RepID=A0AAI9XRZ4_9PEZI|nr:hypothetical protein CMEL01_15902 [Colletotrichum melonis]